VHSQIETNLLFDRVDVLTSVGGWATLIVLFAFASFMYREPCQIVINQFVFHFIHFRSYHLLSFFFTLGLVRAYKKLMLAGWQAAVNFSLPAR
jgi:hypothetical protein